MIHGRPRRRGLRRIQLFFKHAALVFAYTTYISITALIVLKMAARGGYADQVGMSHPLARLFMIAITSAVAIGVFWWLKRELGDHTRHQFTDMVTDLTHRGREGYQRGQDAYQRARQLNSRAPWTNKARTNPDPDDSNDDPDQPLTGPPAQGRPPGGRPPSPGRGPTPGPHPSPTTGHAGAAGSAGAAAAAGGAASEAAAAVVAPEAVAATAVASQIGQRLHRGHTTRTGQPTTAPSHAAPASKPASDTPQPTPVTGRTTTTGSNPAQQPTSVPHNNQAHPGVGPRPDRGDTTDSPVRGRQ